MVKHIEKKTVKIPALLVWIYQPLLVVIGFYLLWLLLVYSYKKSNPQPIPPTINLSEQIISPTIVNEVYKNTTATKPPLPVLNGGNIFRLVNEYRTSKGLSQLTVSDELCRLAEKRADLMMANKMEAFKKSGTGSHYGFDDISYSGNGVGENLAGNVGIDADVVTIWKKSPPHNELMLWTSKDGTPITKGCIATRVSEVGSITVLLVGDK